jgi:hypothetical protein
MKLISRLYKLARTANDIRAIAEPKRAARRIKNKIVGRALGKLGFWRKIWS